MTTSAQFVKTLASVTNNSPSLDYSHPDNQTTQTKCKKLGKKGYLVEATVIKLLQRQHDFIFVRENQLSHCLKFLVNYDTNEHTTRTYD